MTISDKIFITGTQAEFDAWHATALVDADIPAQGKVGMYRGKPATAKQKTTAVSAAIAHPITPDLFMWTHNGFPHETKPSKTFAEVKVEGFYPDDGGAI